MNSAIPFTARMLNGVRFHLNSAGELYRWDATDTAFKRVATHDLGALDCWTLGVRQVTTSSGWVNQFTNLSDES